MRLEQRPDQRQVVGVADDHCVRVADGDRDDLEARDSLALVDLDRPDAPVRSRRPATGVRRRSRSPTRTVTSSAPLRSASHRATIRVPLPDSSAVDPSGFQITISASRPATATTSRMPSEPPTSARTRSGVSGAPSSALSASRYSLPAARQRENVIGHLVGRTVGPHANEAGDPAHPLPLVGGELPRAGDERASASSRGSSPTSRRPMILRAVVESGRARARRTSSSTPASNIARVRRTIRRSSSVGGTSSPTIVVGWRVSPAQSRSPRRRMPRLGELERPHDPPPVVRVHGRRSLGVASARTRVRVLGPLSS